MKKITYFSPRNEITSDAKEKLKKEVEARDEYLKYLQKSVETNGYVNCKYCEGDELIDLEKKSIEIINHQYEDFTFYFCKRCKNVLDFKV